MKRFAKKVPTSMYIRPCLLACRVPSLGTVTPASGRWSPYGVSTDGRVAPPSIGMECLLLFFFSYKEGVKADQRGILQFGILKRKLLQTKMQMCDGQEKQAKFIGVEDPPRYSCWSCTSRVAKARTVSYLARPKYREYIVSPFSRVWFCLFFWSRRVRNHV
ncbi:hypothetical protein BO99DRAFT_53926 [Aspergillus violaceofuscus CBS 115571]|uniref:Uncharacterized protein n=1 Tax=Aspergillus violaceofuscus (strain CBS 115571) TaxID=1450538 RepID=A0A2V5HKF7_ASPV1|nr:hypothetical protein BO99DRAFT_53926 [Aspergillus violaceofuscus CBS 115571]